MIRIKNLTYTYPSQDLPALDDVLLDIEAGEFVLLTGASGAGKSTLLRTLSGLVPHFSGGRLAGSVLVDGQEPIVEGPQGVSQTVGFVFQNPEAQAVVDQVEAEIAFALENAAVPEAEMRVRVEEVLQLLELAPLRRRSLNTLSGGERQRVAIAAALAMRPKVLALDEPTSQLDPQSAADVLNALVRLNEELGLTIVLAEHRLERILRYAERVVVMGKGCVVADGYMPEVLQEMPQLPPLAALGRRLSWEPLPVTVKDGLRFARRLDMANVNGKTAKPAAVDGNGGPPMVLDAREVRFAYGRKRVLNGVDLQVRAGEAVVLMGRNGSGKTTLLRCLVGLLKAQSGEVLIAERSIEGRRVADICRDVAYLPQSSDDLLFSETVYEELAVTLRNHAMNGAGQVIEPLLEQLDLLEYAGAYPRDLSAGQRQRVALGAVAVTRPSLLMLDEPTRGLDYEAKEDLVALWRHLRKRGMGLLMVTHDVELAAQVADRVLILSEGELIADGPAGDVLGASPLFAPQVARLFPGQGWLTVEDALVGLGAAAARSN
ncbi:MAG: ABC transporter ATP-binding protein [Chloroflexota bacterium]